MLPAGDMQGPPRAEEDPALSPSSPVEPIDEVGVVGRHRGGYGGVERHPGNPGLAQLLACSAVEERRLRAEDRRLSNVRREMVDLEPGVLELVGRKPDDATVTLEVD